MCFAAVVVDGLETLTPPGLQNHLHDDRSIKFYWMGGTIIQSQHSQMVIHDLQDCQVILFRQLNSQLS